MENTNVYHNNATSDTLHCEFIMAKHGGFLHRDGGHIEQFNGLFLPLMLIKICPYRVCNRQQIVPSSSSMIYVSMHPILLALDFSHALS